MKPVALAVALAVAMTALLVVPGTDAATTSRTLTISNSSAHPQVPFGGFDGNPHKVFDMDGDGDLEIIAQNDNHWVYVFDSRTGAILAEIKSTVPSGWGARTFNGPEVAVFDSDGTVRLIIQSSAAVIGSYRVDLNQSTSTHIKLVKEWERRLNDCYGGAGADSKPVLADLDKDGKYEIVAATEELGLYALRANGQLYWKNCIGGGNAEPTVADINLDGWPDVVFGSDGGVVSAHNGRTGGWMWGYNVLSHFPLHSASMPVGVGIGQLDGLGGLDIVVGARDSHNATDFSQNHAMLLALSSGGTLLWARQDPTGNPLTYTHPIVADAAGDGQNEVYWADWNTMGHKPGNWEVTGPANFYRYDKAGNLVWKQSLNTYWNNKDLALADVDGDGVQEILANGPGTGGDGIWYLDSRTGAKETFVATTSWKVARAPVVADLWGTGTMQWVVEVGPADNTNTGGGLLVYDTHAPYNAKWPHLPYPSLGSGTGTTTSTTSTTGTTTTTTGTTTTGTTTSTTSTTGTTTTSTTTTTSGPFDATFTGVRGNEWWVQAQVATNGPAITKVDVSLNGGAWQTVTKQSWGWGASYRIVQGTIVQLRATASDGQTDLSSCRQWIPPSNQDAPIVTCGTGTGTTTSSSSSGTTTGGTFTATFSPRAVGNDWWVEATVTGNQPIARVEAKVNGGAWTVLPATDWGTYAKSIYAPNGSQVTFRATTAAGATATSASYLWG